MKEGTIVERHYSISNMSGYQNPVFLNELDAISESEGIKILERTINEKNSTVKIKARFNTTHWDVCQSLDFLSKNNISVSPITEYEFICEGDCCSHKADARKVLSWLNEHQAA